LSEKLTYPLVSAVKENRKAKLIDDSSKSKY